MKPYDGLAIPPSLSRAIIFLCYFMIVWSLVFPMTWISGILPTTAWYPGLLQSRLTPRFSLIPLDVTTKYTGHAAVTLTHNLPSALWSVLVLIQLSPSIRKMRPRVHRFCGYLHALVSTALIVGVAIMQYRCMFFSMHPAVVWFLQATSGWFMFTLVYAILAARSGLYRAHRAWMLRHIASGIWVAVQRISAAAVLGPLGIFQHPTEMQRTMAFSMTSIVAYAFTIIFTEVYLLTSVRNQMRALAAKVE